MVGARDDDGGICRQLHGSEPGMYGDRVWITECKVDFSLCQSRHQVGTAPAGYSEPHGRGRLHQIGQHGAEHSVGESRVCADT